MNVESADVIRLIQQFLKEHNLHKTLETLQSESGVSLNTVDNIDKFKDDIIKGRWDVVLTTVAHANIPNEHLIDLYEQIIMELVETQDLSAARALLRQTEPMEIMRRKQPDRYLAMEHLISRVTTDGPSGYSDSMSGGKEERRRKISEQLIRHVSTAPPSRLLTLLAQAVKWEQEKQGLVVPKDIPFDLFHGKSTQPLMAGDDRIPNKQISTVKFPKKQHPGCLALSSKNSYLATGSMDGFIEIWDSMTGKLAPSLQYQKDGALMMMEGAITSLAFSHSGDLICSGAKDGKIKIWKTASGTSHKKLPAAHTQEVTCVAFSADDSQVLSGSYTGALRIHGLKSGNMLKELRGHSAAITGAIFFADVEVLG
ncbi:hypothetical protein GGI07_005005 [Coemansia sp. Benny D115]|nr:hypothetical protein GGI07_005005 [Coemansia sp. Benny D115]